VARSLRALHAHGFAHRDCFARNVLVGVGPPVGVWWLDCRRAALRPLRRGPRRDLADLVGDLAARASAEEIRLVREAYEEAPTVAPAVPRGG
jgi:hypothetical protein